MIRHKAAGRYAKAVFDMATESGRLDRMREDLLGLGKMMHTSEDFAGFLGNYLIPSERRVKALRALVENKVDALTLTFLLLLEEKKRLGLLGEICEAFEERYDAHMGILKVTITSATDLAAGQLEAIDQRLAAKFGKQIKTSTRTNPYLIGGFRLQVGDLIEDYSLINQLQVLKENMIHA